MTNLIVVARLRRAGLNASLITPCSERRAAAGLSSGQIKEDQGRRRSAFSGQDETRAGVPAGTGFRPHLASVGTSYRRNDFVKHRH